MPMDYGMPSLIELNSLEENCRLCSSLNLDFLEINMNFPEYQAESFDAELYSALKNKYGIYFTVHLSESMDVADINPKVRNAWLETVSETIDFAKKIQCPVINMHMNHGICVTFPEKKQYIYEYKNREFMESMEAFRNFCQEKIGDSGIKICIENTDGFKDFEKNAVNMLLISPVFALTWDIGHSIKSDEADMDFLLSNISHLKHFHIHDGTRKENGGRCHQELGRGEINLNARISLAKECGARCVIETKTAASLKNSVKWLESNSLK